MSSNRRTKKAKKHGGKRLGAGRPALPAAKARTVRIAIRLTPAEAKRIQRAGGENVSEWIREQILQMC